MTYEPPKNGFRTFLALLGTQGLSVFGSGIAYFAVNIWLTQVAYPAPEQRTELAFALSAVGLVYLLPMVLTSPISGAWADRHDRRRIMLTADLILGALTTVLVVLMVTGRLTFPVLLLIMLLQGIAGNFHQSAFEASSGMLIPHDQMPRANGMMQTVFSVSGVVAPAAAAALVATGPSLGLPLTLAVDAVTFFISAGALLFMEIPSPRRTETVRKSMWADVKEGAAFVTQRKPLLWLMTLPFVVNLGLASLPVFIPLLLKFALADNWAARGFTFETALAMINTVGSLGAVLGGVIISSWGGLKRGRVYGVIIPFIIGGAAMVVHGLAPDIYLVVAARFLLMMTVPFVSAHGQAIWQGQVPKELHGRVFAVRRVLATCSAPIATVLAGVLGGLFNPGVAVAALGGLIFLVCAVQLFNPVLLRVEDKEYMDSMAARPVLGD